MKICLKCKRAFFAQGWVCPSCGFVPVRLGGVEAHAPEFANEGGGFKSEYFNELARLEASNFWFQARNDLILWALRTYVPDLHNFLEIGCGTGFVLSGISSEFPNAELSGSEIFLAGLPFAMGRNSASNFMQMDARRIPFFEEFDAVGAFDVLEHVVEDEVVLNQIHRALKVNGLLFLTVPQHPWLWSDVDDYACHVRRYSKAEIESKLKSAGFEVLRSTSFVTLLLPLMIVSRLLQKNRKQNSDFTSELRINPILNWCFFCLLKLEIVGIRFGINYPFGGSRMVVARRV